MTEKKRDLNLDLTRCAALVAVLVMHYYDNSGFYTVVMDSPGDFVMAALRLLFTVCVPFFLMLSGYLCHGCKHRAILLLIKIFSGQYIRSHHDRVTAHKHGAQHRLLGFRIVRHDPFDDCFFQPCIPPMLLSPQPSVMPLPSDAV